MACDRYKRVLIPPIFFCARRPRGRLARELGLHTLHVDAGREAARDAAREAALEEAREAAVAAGTEGRA